MAELARRCTATLLNGSAQCTRKAIKEGLCIQHAKRAGIWKPEDDRTAYYVSIDGTVLTAAECITVHLTDQQAADLCDNWPDSDKQAIAIDMARYGRPRTCTSTLHNQINCEAAGLPTAQWCDMCLFEV